MIGACADWFAVVALFRHPLGLPIPHTAIVPHNKERIGGAIGRFISNNFLSPKVLSAKIREIDTAGLDGALAIGPGKMPIASRGASRRHCRRSCGRCRATRSMLSWRAAARTESKRSLPRRWLRRCCRCSGRRARRRRWSKSAISIAARGAHRQPGPDQGQGDPEILALHSEMGRRHRRRQDHERVDATAGGDARSRPSLADRAWGRRRKLIERSRRQSPRCIARGEELQGRDAAQSRSCCEQVNKLWAGIGARLDATSRFLPRPDIRRP